jgi:hypothetical protein
MYVGAFFFTMLFVEWSLKSIGYYLLGVFFFYVLGIISHLIYDKGTARSEPKYFIKTLPAVISINFLTSIGLYDSSLRKFCEKYPFTHEAFELIELKPKDLLPHLLGKTR